MFLSGLALMALASPLVVSADDFSQQLTAPQLGTVVSIEVEWDPGDTVDAQAIAAPVEEVVETPESDPEAPHEGERSVPDNAVEQQHSAPPSGDSAAIYGVSDLRFQGVINWNGTKWTYYSQSVLPGGGLRIPGRHVSGGFVRDADGYISVAASPGIPHGTVVATPFGSPGKVYDTCANCSSNWFDAYTQ